MNDSNLPPGVTEGMIPGNTAEDARWEELIEWMVTNCCDLSCDEIKERLSFGPSPQACRDLMTAAQDIFNDDGDRYGYRAAYHSMNDNLRKAMYDAMSAVARDL